MSRRRHCVTYRASPFKSSPTLLQPNASLSPSGLGWEPATGISAPIKKAGHRVMTSLTRFIEGRLKLQVNAQKSAVEKMHQECRCFGIGAMHVGMGCMVSKQ
jgi:hypothetical protein